jgi:phospholipid/cholesterol/gamma-HCH transport system substrate-binding protein
MFDIKKQLQWSKLKVGLVISLALLALFFGIFFAGNIEEIFLPKMELKVQFRDVKGLRKGAPVWIFGTEVGSVKNIQLSPVHGTIVTLSVNKSAQTFIKKDSQASILTMGLLGDKFVELSTGSPLAEPIRHGEMIKGTAQIEFSDIMGTAAIAIGKLGELITKLDRFVLKIETGQGTFAKFFADPTVYDNLKSSTHALALLLENVRESQGTIKMLIEDPSLYNKMLTAASSLEELSRRINESSGTLKQFVEDPSLYHKMLAAVSSIEEFGRRMNESSGTLKSLVEDPSLYNTTLSAASSIEEFSRKLNEGSGTLNRLIENPELYENLRKTSAQLSSLMERIDKGEGLAGAFIRDEELAKELKGTIVELKELMKDIKDHPKKYFKFSIF